VIERACATCTLCCTLLPVVTLKKGAGMRCIHQRSLLDTRGPAGCNVHHKPKNGFPLECGLWNCRWLVDDSMKGLQRPDICHYVVDIVPDFITAKEGGREVKMPVIQVWVDPRYPEAHKDEKLREWIRVNEPECMVLVRFSDREATALIPPHMSDTNEWEEVGGNRMTTDERTHTGEEIAAVLTQTGAMK
jgi:hypothetical protein